MTLVKKNALIRQILREIFFQSPGFSQQVPAGSQNIKIFFLKKNFHIYSVENLG